MLVTKFCCVMEGPWLKGICHDLLCFYCLSLEGSESVETSHYFNEKPKREVKLFHFENARKILSCHPSTSILSVQTTCLIWREICLKRIYTPIDLLFIEKCHSLQVYVLQASFLCLPGQAEQMRLCEARAPCALPVSCWKWAWSWRMTTGTISSVRSFPLAQLYLTSSHWPRPNTAVLQQHKADQTCIFLRTDEVRELSLLQRPHS